MYPQYQDLSTRLGPYPSSAKCGVWGTWQRGSSRPPTSGSDVLEVAVPSCSSTCVRSVAKGVSSAVELTLRVHFEPAHRLPGRNLGLSRSTLVFHPVDGPPLKPLKVLI